MALVSTVDLSADSISSLVTAYNQSVSALNTDLLALSGRVSGLADLGGLLAVSGAFRVAGSLTVVGSLSAAFSGAIASAAFAQSAVSAGYATLAGTVVSLVSALTLGSALHLPYVSTTTSAVVSTAQTVAMGTSCAQWLLVTVSGVAYRVPLFSAV